VAVLGHGLLGPLDASASPGSLCVDRALAGALAGALAAVLAGALAAGAGLGVLAVRALRAVKDLPARIRSMASSNAVSSL